MAACVSSTGAVLFKVPQGSTLSPLLFLLYINVISEVPLNSTIVLYACADDMLLYHIVDTPEHMDTLQTDVDRVSDWPSYSKCGKDKIYATNPAVCSLN